MTSSAAAPRKKVYCAICGPAAGSREKYPECLDDAAMNFSARKTPRRNHFKILECLECGLVYSDNIFADDHIAQLYREAQFLDEPQLANMCGDYIQALKQVLRGKNEKDVSLLEVGCANGFFLKEAKAMGLHRVIGVEPGADAVSRAVPEARLCIINDFFHEDLFPHEKFDIVCFFQVIDHLLQPVDFLKSVFKILRPGGIALTVNHNIHSLGPQVLGDRSPMYDIEHMYLFDKKNIRMAFEKTGFEIITVAGMRNSYTLAYCVKMFPLPGWLRTCFLFILEKLNAGHLNLKLPAGNMITIAKKPEA